MPARKQIAPELLAEAKRALPPQIFPRTHSRRRKLLALVQPARCAGVGGDGVEFRGAAGAADEDVMKERFLYRAGTNNVVSELSEDMKEVLRHNTETLE